MTITNEVAS